MNSSILRITITPFLTLDSRLMCGRSFPFDCDPEVEIDVLGQCSESWRWVCPLREKPDRVWTWIASIERWVNGWFLDRILPVQQYDLRDQYSCHHWVLPRNVCGYLLEKQILDYILNLLGSRIPLQLLCKAIHLILANGGETKCLNDWDMTEENSKVKRSIGKAFSRIPKRDQKVKKD